MMAGSPILVDPGAGGRLLVKRHQPGNDAVQVLLAQLTPIRHLIHHAVLGHPDHLQGIVHRLSRAAHPTRPRDAVMGKTFR